MKKFFLLFSALVAFTAANAATEDDLQVCKHSKVFVMDNYTGNGTGSRTKAGLAFAGYFWDVTGGSVATNKGSIDPGALPEGIQLLGCEEADTVGFAAKYAKYGSHLNSLRIKNAQDVFALKVTAGSKVIILGKSGGGSARSPQVASDAALTNKLSTAQASTNAPFFFVYTATDDQTIYVGSYNGDTYVSYVIVEAQEAAGTPTVEVSDMQYDGSLYYKDVTCTANNYIVDGMDLGPTEVYYTLDGTDPTMSSTKYTDPIRCYNNQTVKFAAYYSGLEDTRADNEETVEFTFDAPTLEVSGNQFVISTTYNNATNYYTLNGGDAVAGDAGTLESSAKIVAYTEIANGSYATFTTPTTYKFGYVLDPIKEEKTITVSGDVVVNDSATAASTDGTTVYEVQNGSTTMEGDKCFFIQNVEYTYVNETEYQAPEGQAVYMKMTDSEGIFTFYVEEKADTLGNIYGDSVKVTVTCSKNSCKNIDSEADRGCYVNVDGTSYGNADVTAEGGNIIEFVLGPGIHIFKKYSGTGNIKVSKIVITPIETTGINEISSAAASKSSAAYNLAGQRVSDSFKGIQIKNGKKFIVK